MPSAESDSHPRQGAASDLVPTPPDVESQRPGAPEAPLPAAIARWVKTECGRAKYLELASRPGAWAQLRLWWFVLIAALRDWRLPPSALS